MELKLSPSLLTKFNKYTDKEIIKFYRETNESIYVSVMLSRYEPLLLKIISQWHKRYSIPLSKSDFKDVLQTAYVGMMYCFKRVGDVDAIKNVGSRIKSYVYNELNKEYRHRKVESYIDDTFESKDGEYEFSNRHDYSTASQHTEPVRFTSEFQYLVYNYQYNSYKLGLMYLGTKSRRNMKIYISRKRNKLKKKMVQGK